MPEKDIAFATLMERVQAGCADAAMELHESYGRHILKAVRRRLHNRLRSKYDSLDFVQDVWVSFFADVPQQRRFAEPRDLVAFLSRMAENKVAQAVRKRLVRQKYNINRERRLETPVQADVPAPGATPSEVLMGREEWDQLLQRQPLVHRRILILMREGKSPEEISEELGISQKTVLRAIRRALPEDPS
ncbi:MAG: sigma-70 family RNA polymerase sigma factor [Planctomycetes bacterium]|nr:sigma-70 family RNA polymerase sigma factor [Planctomycetota bacterium]